MSDERRNAERVELPLEARWEGQSGKHSARISDLGIGGCYIATYGQVTDGEVINFEIQLPTGNWMRLRGQVAYCHPNMGFGVRFKGLSESEAHLIEDLIAFGK